MTKDHTQTAVLYARVASATQADQTRDTDRQFEECRRMADALDVTVEQEFADHGISGLTLERPALRQLFTYVETHPTDYVICAKLSQVAREVVLSHQVALQLRRHGARLAIASLDAVIDVHLGSAEATDTSVGTTT